MLLLLLLQLQLQPRLDLSAQLAVGIKENSKHSLHLVGAGFVNKHSETSDAANPLRYPRWVRWWWADVFFLYKLCKLWELWLLL
jgi:hypothetical protein